MQLVNLANVLAEAETNICGVSVRLILFRFFSVFVNTFQESTFKGYEFNSK
jgi:hypothetical protein